MLTFLLTAGRQVENEISKYDFQPWTFFTTDLRTFILELQHFRIPWTKRPSGYKKSLGLFAKKRTKQNLRTNTTNYNPLNKKKELRINQNSILTLTEQKDWFKITSWHKHTVKTNQANTHFYYNKHLPRTHNTYELPSNRPPAPVFFCATLSNFQVDWLKVKYSN